MGGSCPLPETLEGRAYRPYAPTSGGKSARCHLILFESPRSRPARRHDQSRGGARQYAHSAVPTRAATRGVIVGAGLAPPIAVDSASTPPHPGATRSGRLLSGRGTPGRSKPRPYAMPLMVSGFRVCWRTPGRIAIRPYVLMLDGLRLNGPRLVSALGSIPICPYERERTTHTISSLSSSNGAPWKSPYTCSATSPACSSITWTSDGNR